MELSIGVQWDIMVGVETDGVIAHNRWHSGKLGHAKIPKGEEQNDIRSDVLGGQLKYLKLPGLVGRQIEHTRVSANLLKTTSMHAGPPGSTKITQNDNSLFTSHRSLHRKNSNTYIQRFLLINRQSPRKGKRKVDRQTRQIIKKDRRIYRAYATWYICTES